VSARLSVGVCAGGIAALVGEQESSRGGHLVRHLFVAVSLLIASSAVAQVSEVTPFVGYQGGGSITLNGLDTRLDQQPEFGVFVTFDRGRGRKLDLLVSHQATRAERHDPFVE